MGPLSPVPSDNKMVAFGKPMRKLFPLHPDWTNLNHGSFGTFPHAVREERQRFEDELDGIPDTFIRYASPGYIDNSRAALAKYLNVPMNEVVYVKNATTGVNVVLRNLVYKPGDIIVYFSCIYGACEKTIAYLAEVTPLKARKIMLEFPCTHDDIIQRFTDVVRKARAEGLNVRIALFDTIASQPGLRLPFERLVETCREEGILSCIDGAHGVGQIPLDLAKLNADFFVSNCHKWLYTPRGSAVFHVPVRNQHLIRTTLPTSWGFQPAPDVLSDAVPRSSKPIRFPSVLPPGGSKSTFEHLFEYVATNNDIPYFCIPAALKFRQEVCGGEARIMEYCENLAFEAGNLVAKILGTDILCEPGAEMQTTRGASQFRRCALVNVRLPIAVDDGTGAHHEGNKGYPVIKLSSVEPLARWIEKELTYKHNTMLPVFHLGAWMWARLSAQIYLELEDFEWAGNVMKGILERVAKGEGPGGLEIDLENLKIN
uniref:Isopenicillin N-epimerase n=1 Tax=Coccidioides posadasii RMSCC 3488 TaxID=454284 RepID=A0A0J6FNR6_COCPO|nr:isopenicillin N-epimerase [Coccidioides posadasii RMSCC 3488]